MRVRSASSRLRGASVVEILIASSLAVLIVSALMALMLETAVEQRWGLVESQLHGQAGLVQDRLTRLIREMSATESTIFGDPTQTGSPFYQRIIVARGAAPGSPREEIIYNPQTMSLTYDPDRSTSGDEVPLHDASSSIKLRNAYFYPSMKPGGIPDTTSINVWLELDDDGAAGRKGEAGSDGLTSVVRSFTVTMRNN